MKKKTLWLCGFLLLGSIGFAQEGTLRFKLYLEAANGKKDTLELGVSPDGYVGCDYDSNLCEPVFYPFEDTVDRIGAFVVPDLDIYGNLRDQTPIRVMCPVFWKKRIGKNENDLTIVVPASAQPIKISWDKSILASPIIETPFLTTMLPGSRFDQILTEYWQPIYRLIMSDTSSYTVGYDFPGTAHDSLIRLTYIPDSAGNDHPYIHFFILPGYDRHVASEKQKKNTCPPIRLTNNPVKDLFAWEAEFPIKDWRIYALTGKVLKQGNASLKEFYCGNWPNGLYVFVAYDQNNKPYPVKFVKQ